MKIKNLETYGYLIGADIQVFPQQLTVLRVYPSRHLRDYSVDPLFLGETMMRLLAYLLARADDDVIPYPDVLSAVWDEHGLVSSYKRLSQVIIALKRQLGEMGLPDDFIQTVRGRGFRIEADNIKPLYFKTSAPDRGERYPFRAGRSLNTPSLRQDFTCAALPVRPDIHRRARVTELAAPPPWTGLCL